MNTASYAQGVLSAIKSGVSPKDALATLHALLKKAKRESLFPRVLSLVLRSAEHMRGEIVSIAHERTAIPKHLSHVERRINASLLGGYRWENGEIMIDTSHKRALIDIYKQSIS